VGKIISARQWEIYENRRKRGWAVTEASRAAGFNPSAGYKREGSTKERVWNALAEYQEAFRVSEPVPFDRLRVEARRALDDFAFFQLRYFGKIATPWQAEAAGLVLGWLSSPDKEFAVINVGPGSGKTTLFTRDLPCWLTCRDRAIRGLIGSRTALSATRYCQTLKRMFQQTVPLQGEPEAVARGLACDAVATLADDFGAFRPPSKDQWAGDAFVVLQPEGRLITEKEPTWSAYGQESGFLGMRYDFIVWDDLVDPKVLRTVDSREGQQAWWDDMAEKRLEPGGLLLLQGQRLGPDDLYRYCLDKPATVLETDADFDSDGTDVPRKYHHIVFKAHYQDRCRDEHGVDAPYYPQGCLLDPRRLAWRELRAEMANARNNFEIIYQQADVDRASVLVDPAWVYGGSDPVTGEVFPGCTDPERGLAELPPGLAGQLLSVATVDPSPAKWWSCQWWVVRCVSGVPQERYLMDHVRQRMDAPTFLDWNERTRSFTGLAEDWQARSDTLGWPITTWVVEANAAQRFMLQFEHVRRWLAAWRISLIPHQTAANKSDPAYGVQTLGAVYRYGLVRLPFRTRTPAYNASIKLIDEVTHWPGWRSDDTVMAQWFLEWHLPHLIPTGQPLPRAPRPSWLSGQSTWGWRRQRRAELVRAR
jgi:hypothetical protein